MKQYFTELEAAEAASVSLETIREFITLGMLKLNPPDETHRQSYLTQADLISSFHTLKDLGVTVEIPNSSRATPTIPTTPPSPSFQCDNLVDSVEQFPLPERGEFSTPSPKPTSHIREDTLIEHRSFELLDLNKSLKEQIDILKQERDWLRQRVEKLEVRSERDQLLLMSETKNVQTLLPNHTDKRSFWSFLPWFQN